MEKEKLYKIINDALMDFDLKLEKKEIIEEEIKHIGKTTNLIYICGDVEFRVRYLHNSKLVSLSISKIPYKDMRDYISVDVFFSKKLKDYNIKELTLDYYIGNDEERLKSLMLNLIKRINQSKLPIHPEQKWDTYSYPDWTTRG